MYVLEECGDWYYGRSKFKGTCGIFPKSYIHIQQSMSIDCLIHEITNVLREWGHHWKHLYMVRILQRCKCYSTDRDMFDKTEFM